MPSRGEIAKLGQRKRLRPPDLLPAARNTVAVSPKGRMRLQSCRLLGNLRKIGQKEARGFRHN
jgi:propanediol utilization protein